MNRLRQGNNLRISFFAFQDIITSVTGILILVALILSFSLRLEADPEAERGEADLKKQKETLAALERENTRLQQARITASSVTAPEIRVRIERLRREEEQARINLARSQTELQAASEHAERTTNAVQLRSEVASLEQNIQELQTRLQNEKTNTNRLMIIPSDEALRSQKRPVMIVVNEKTIHLQPLGQQAGMEVQITDRSSLRDALRRHNSGKEFIVFYFRPSGAKWFDAFRDEARKSGFEVGYDAVEEEKEIVFATP